MSWNRCQTVWEGVVCDRLTRYPGGKQCSRCANRLTDLKHPDTRKKRWAKYYAENKEKCRQCVKRNYYKNRAARLLRAAVYRDQNKEKIREYNVTRRKAQRQAKAALYSKGVSSGTSAQTNEASGGVVDLALGGSGNQHRKTSDCP